jgi:opacity protein-like surface antigen
MKSKILILVFIFLSMLSNAQFEQNISLDFKAGIFKTFGSKLADLEGYIPLQMPNYKTGFSANGGVQFKINNRLFLSAEFGIIISEKWYFAGEYSSSNYLSWSFTDTITGDYYTGENSLGLINFNLGIKPKYYLLTGKKLNPYFFAGVNINLTRSNYEDTQWNKMKQLDYLPPWDTGPGKCFLENNFGIGFNPGIGIEYTLNDRIHFDLEPGYYLIFLKKENFAYPERSENFNAFVFQAGLRYYFVKTREL